MAVRIQGGGELDGAILAGVATEDGQNAIRQLLGGLPGELGRTTADNINAANDSGANMISRMAQGTMTAVTETLTGTASTIAGISGNLIQGNFALTDQTKVLKDSFGNLNTGSNFLNGAFATLAGGADNVVKYIQDSADAFRGMSDAGGGLEGDLITLRVAAAQTRMPLDEFAGMVTENSAKLLALGGSVDQGTRAFVEQSKAFYDSRLGLGVQALGIGFEESNQYLMDYMDAQRRNDTYQNMTTSQRNKAAQDYIYELDTLARLTGKSRKELQDEARQRMRAGQTQAALRQIEKRTGQDVTAAYQTMARDINGTLGPGFADMFDSMVALNGAIDPTNEAMKGLYAAAPEAAESMSQAAKLMNQGDIEGANRMMEQAQAQALARMDSDEYLSVARLGGLAGAVGTASSDLLEVNQDFLDAIKTQIDGNNRAGASAEEFANALNRARENIATAQNNTQSSPTMGGVVATETMIRDTASALVTEIGTQFRTQIEGGMLAVRDTVLNSEIDKTVQDVIRGAGSIIDPSGVDGIINGLQNIINDPEASEQSKANAQQLSEILQEQRAILVDLNSSQAEKEAALASIQAISLEAQNDVTRVREDMQQNDINLVNSLVESVGTAITDAFNSIFGNGTTIPDAEFPNAQFPEGSPPTQMNNGTVGEFGRLFADFGEGTSATLHNNEMVANEAQMREGVRELTSRIQSRAITARANQPAPNQDFSEVINQLRTMLQESGSQGQEMLNTTLQELAGVAHRQLDVQSKNLRASRNLSGNVFKGLGF